MSKFLTKRSYGVYKIIIPYTSYKGKNVIDSNYPWEIQEVGITNNFKSDT